MQLFSYLYIAVVVIPFKQIKVMKLKAFLQLQKSEIQLASRIDSLSNTEILNSLGTNTIIAGTGTTGDTTSHPSGIHTTVGTSLVTGECILIGILIIIAIVLGTVLDRKLNHKQDLNQEFQKLQDQESGKLKNE